MVGLANVYNRHDKSLNQLYLSYINYIKNKLLMLAEQINAHKVLTSIYLIFNSVNPVY